MSTDALVALRQPFVARVIFGRLLMILGRRSLSVALGWELYERTGSAMALGMVGLAQIVPVVALVAPAGALSDRLDRRRVVMSTQLMLTFIAAAFAAASFMAAPVWLFYVLLFFHGVVVAFNSAAVAPLLPELVPAEHFINANAWASTTFQISALVGPALAGVVIKVSGGAGWVYVLDGACALGFAVLMWGLPPRPPRPTTSPNMAGQFTEGMRFFFRNQVLLSAVTLDLFAMLFGGATALMPIFAKDILQVGPVGLGWLQAAPSIGAGAMALVTTRLPPWTKSGQTLCASVVGFAVATIGFGLAPNFWVAMLCLVLIGVFDNISVVIRRTLEQATTPDRLRGRVAAIHFVFIGLSNELGEFESGALAALVGPVLSVVGGGLAALGVVTFAWFYWPVLRKIGRLDEIRPMEP